MEKEKTGCNVFLMDGGDNHYKIPWIDESLCKFCYMASMICKLGMMEIFTHVAKLDAVSKKR